MTAWSNADRPCIWTGATCAVVAEDRAGVCRVMVSHGCRSALPQLPTHLLTNCCTEDLNTLLVAGSAGCGGLPCHSCQHTSSRTAALKT